MLDIQKPIFITGTGRCGSTIFHQIFSHHTQVAWLSQYCARKPRTPHWNRRAMMALDLPLPAYYLRKLIYPVEAYQLWNAYFPGFGRPYRDLKREDVTPRIKKKLRSVMAQMLTSKRQRLLIKITGWPRVGFLKEIFPDAKFIHVYRDGRAVVNSLLDIHFWSGWQGPMNWRWGELSPAQEEKWHRYNGSFVALGAIEWEILMKAHKEAACKIPAEDFLEIRYEDLCQDPIKLFQLAIEFSELDWTSKFERIIHSFSLKDTNYKWREHLTEEQQKILNECLSDVLPQYGYE